VKNLTAISFWLALAASGFLLVVPTYSGSSYSGSSRGGSPIHATLLQVTGPRALIYLAVPVILTLAPMLIPKRAVRAGSALVLATLAVLGGFSIGLFYLPSAFVLLLAAFPSAPVESD